MKLAKLLKKAMVISMEDQVSYCNKTIQVGPHVLVVTTATVDTSGESEREREGEKETTRRGLQLCTDIMISAL